MKRLLILFSIFFFLFSAAFAVYAAGIDELQTKRQELTKQLEELNQQTQEVQGKLDETQNQRNSIQREINVVDQTIKQLNLGIKSSGVNLERLGLELESLDYDLKKTEDEIALKRDAIGELLRQMQQKDNEPFLAMLLKNDSLADGVMELQGLMDLNNGLSIEIINLKEIKGRLNETLDQVAKNKRLAQVENLNLKNRKSIVEDQKDSKKVLLAQTKSQEELYQQQIAELEKKQEEIGGQIDELEQQLRAQFDPSVLPIKRPGVLEYPVQNPRLTQEYGATKFAQRAYKTKFHNGVDFAASIGTPIFAAENGEVMAVDNNDKSTSRWQKYQYGKYILIRHENNLATLYAHLSRQVVQKGDTVKRGDLIGYSGNTGYTTGPHIHLTVYWTPSIQFKSIPPAAGLVPVGVTINPLDYL